MLSRQKRGFDATWRDMKKIDIFDSLFTNSISMAGDKLDFKPKLFEWNNFESNKNLEFPTSPLFFTESQMKCVDYYSDDFDCYLILIEPEALHPENYRRALKLEPLFDSIFCHDSRYISMRSEHTDKWKFYTFGGSWIVNPEITPKTIDIGMIASHKKSLPGHKLRHKVAKYYLGRTQYMDASPILWGSGYTPFDSKRRILADYRFMIVIENVRQDYWFTEKLLDALSMGCVPIYWGCPSINKFFDIDGIIQFETYDELMLILGDLDFKKEYEKRKTVIEKNAKLAENYFICEDVMAKAYPDIFRLDDD